MAIERNYGKKHYLCWELTYDSTIPEHMFATYSNEVASEWCKSNSLRNRSIHNETLFSSNNCTNEVCKNILDYDMTINETEKQIYIVLVNHDEFPGELEASRDRLINCGAIEIIMKKSVKDFGYTDIMQAERQLMPFCYIDPCTKCEDE